MKRRFFIITLVILAAFAALSLAQAEYAMIVGDKTFSEEELTRDQSGEGWKWSAGEGELTLNGYFASPIFCELEKLALAIEGENGIDATDFYYGIYCSGTLDIRGSGSLTSSKGIQVENLLTVTDSALRLTSGGMYGRLGVTASDAQITFENGGIWTSNEYVKLDNTELSVSKGVYGISTRNLEINGGNITIANCEIGILCEEWSGYKSSAILNNLKLRVSDCERGISQVNHSVSDREGVSIDNCDIRLTRMSESGISGDRVYIKNSSYYCESESPTGDAGGYYELQGGCSITVRNKGNGFARVWMTETDELDVLCVYDAIYKNVITLPGDRTVSVTGNRLVVKNGNVEQNSAAVTKLIVGGEELYLEDVIKDASGKGWSWSAKEQTLTLNGHDDDYIELAGAQACLAVEGSNTVRASIMLPDGGLVTGDGELNIRNSLFANDVTVDGPDLKCWSGRLNGLTLKSGTVSTDASAIEVGHLVMEGGKFCSGGRVTVNGAELYGGTIENVQAGEHIWLWAEHGDVVITGGEFTFSTNQYDEYGIKAENGSVSISGTAHVIVKGNAAAFLAKKVLIGGKEYKGEDGVEVLNGEIIRTFSSKVMLMIDDRLITSGEWNTDISGENWRWEAKKRTLTLENATCIVTSFVKGITVRLAAGSVNECFIEFREGGTVLGPGKMANIGGISSQKNLTVKEGAVLDKRNVDAYGNLTLNGCDISSGSIEAGGNITVKNCFLRIENWLMARGGNLTIEKSFVISSRSKESCDDSAYGDVYAKKKLSLKNSALVCGQPEGKPFKRSGSVVFINRGMNDYGTAQVLLGSVSVSRSYEFPEGIWYIPKGMTLKTKGKGKLAFTGKMDVRGAVKGRITLNGEPVKKTADGNESSVERVSEFVEISR